MLFNSYAFLLVFLPLVLLGFAWLSGRHQLATVLFLVVASFAFYAWSSPLGHVALLALSVLFNFGVGLALLSTKNPSLRSILLAIGIAVDLGLLGYFKYSGFFAAQFGELDFARGLLLPLGISFYTFTQIAYLVDVYRGQARGYELAPYALFATWFPHLIAGPILHHSEMTPQFATVFRRRIDWQLVLIGLSILTVGLAKKMLLADQAAPFADAVFDRAQLVPPTFAEAWVGALAYAGQIYFDFSGYTDMACGISLMFGIRLPLNFNSPYKAASIIDFWRRWHMTLSRFLRDYLYIPLGGNRHGVIRRGLNLMITMLLGGFWHGAGWTFVIWGGLHGIYLIANHAWRATRIPLPATLSIAITFFVTVIAWVFFRATDLASALAMLKSMTLANGLSLPGVLQGPLGAFAALGLRFDGVFANAMFPAGPAVITIGVMLAIIWLMPNSYEIFQDVDPMIVPKSASQIVTRPIVTLSWRPTWRWGIALGLLLAASFAKVGGESPFLYFRF
jgi:alginate O-acetyltransferase complex protein AlgI